MRRRGSDARHRWSFVSPTIEETLYAALLDPVDAVEQKTAAPWTCSPVEVIDVDGFKTKSRLPRRLKIFKSYGMITKLDQDGK